MEIIGIIGFIIAILSLLYIFLEPKVKPLIYGLWNKNHDIITHTSNHTYPRPLVLNKEQCLANAEYYLKE